VAVPGSPIFGRGTARLRDSGLAVLRSPAAHTRAAGPHQGRLRRRGSVPRVGKCIRRSVSSTQRREAPVWGCRQQRPRLVRALLHGGRGPAQKLPPANNSTSTAPAPVPAPVPAMGNKGRNGHRQWHSSMSERIAGWTVRRDGQHHGHHYGHHYGHVCFPALHSSDVHPPAFLLSEPAVMGGDARCSVGGRCRRSVPQNMGRLKQLNQQNQQMLVSHLLHSLHIPLRLLTGPTGPIPLFPPPFPPGASLSLWTGQARWAAGVGCTLHTHSIILC
jgi:hypothetical protein